MDSGNRDELRMVRVSVHSGQGDRMTVRLLQSVAVNH